MALINVCTETIKPVIICNMSCSLRHNVLVEIEWHVHYTSMRATISVDLLDATLVEPRVYILVQQLLHAQQENAQVFAILYKKYSKAYTF